VLRLLLIAFGLLTLSWAILIVLARRLPAGAAKDLATVLPACELTGERLDRRQLDGWQRRARRLYEVSSHIFEDEVEALAALGVVSTAGPEAASIASPLLPPAA
jgi:hypothetical protein